MNTRIKRKKSTKPDDRLIDSIIEELQEADRIVIGAGAGLSASAGLDYNDKEFFKNNYEPFSKEGYDTVFEAISDHWEMTTENATLIRINTGFPEVSKVVRDKAITTDIDIHRLLKAITNRV